MLSTLDNSQHDRRDVLEISPDVVLVARAAADFPTLAPEAMGREAHMDAEIPRVDATFRASDTTGQRSSPGKWIRRAAVTFAFAFMGVVATAAWVRDDLDLTLRIGMASVGDIRAKGFDVRVARYAPSENISIAMFSSATSLQLGVASSTSGARVRRTK